MKLNVRSFLLVLSVVCGVTAHAKFTNFPDGSKVPDWFNDSKPVDVRNLGKQYVITEHGVLSDSTVIQTENIQRVIDLAASNGGGVIVIPEGTYLSGSLFFKPGTHLHLLKGGKLKGSDAITNYKIVKTRLEGQTLDYFATDSQFQAKELSTGTDIAFTTNSGCAEK